MGWLPNLGKKFDLTIVKCKWGAETFLTKHKYTVNFNLLKSYYNKLFYNLVIWISLGMCSDKISNIMDNYETVYLILWVKLNKVFDCVNLT